MDKSRILAKLGEVDGYLTELDAIVPATLEEYERGVAIKRASERLLHIAIEGVIDVCAILVKELKLGVPREEEDFFEKLSGKVITKETAAKLKDMKRFRNVLVHRYVEIDNAKVYDILKNNLEDFEEFKKEVTGFIKKKGKEGRKGERR